MKETKIDNSKMKRFLITSSFAAICVAIGFMMATGWETPARVSAQQSDKNRAAPAQYSTLLLNNGSDSPFIKVAEAAKPVVVNITAEKNFDHPNVPDIFDWGPFFGEPPRERRKRPMITSGGSGIIIDREGHILTNNHVVSDAEEITVKLADQSEHKAKVIGKDPETDVALIKIEAEIDPGMVARLGDSEKIRTGEWAIAVGNPFGLDWTVTVGVISARGRSNLRIGGASGPSYQDFIQTDASINYGNSGGPLMNIRGEVIGINTAINAQGQGIGFAIPINLASKVVDQLMTSGEVHRGYLGIQPAELDEIKREALGIENGMKGVFVARVEPDTPAEKGGLEAGEIITAIEGKPVSDVTEFRFRIADYPPDSKVQMSVWKKGKVKKIKFKLGDRQDFINRPVSAVPSRDEYWLGINIAATDSRQGRRFGVEEQKGVVVIDVDPESPARGLLEPGDVIVEVGGIEIESVSDWERAVNELQKRKKAIPFWVFRDGFRTFIPIRPE